MKLWLSLALLLSLTYQAQLRTLANGATTEICRSEQVQKPFNPDQQRGSGR